LLPNTGIGRANLDGTDGNPRFIIGIRPQLVAVASHYIYNQTAR
jgi:hypothetical protein